MVKPEESGPTPLSPSEVVDSWLALDGTTAISSRGAL